MAERPTSQPRVSLVVRTQGRRLRLLERALASIRRQCEPSVEAIIVEDGSSEAGALVEAMNANGSVMFRELPIAASGRCVAGNRGLEASRGEFVGFLDEDDELLPDHVSRLAAALDATPGVDLVYARANEVVCGGLVSDEVREPETLPPGQLVPFSRTALWRHNQFPIQAALFRRSLFEREGGFDPAIQLLEDWDLWIRYSACADFLAIDAVTSLFRSPREPSLIEARVREHRPWMDVLRLKHRDLIAPHRFEDVVQPPPPPPQTPTFRQALGIGRRALARKLGLGGKQ
ncbi:MAG: glycosyltransferase family 2 protein [Novosphingobium sp.]|nr:glycosyltransferase family 2 protein [Novosphingobium sp.]